jgi:hypothetical protein
MHLLLSLFSLGGAHTTGSDSAELRARSLGTAPVLSHRVLVSCRYLHELGGPDKVGVDVVQVDMAAGEHKQGPFLKVSFVSSTCARVARPFVSSGGCSELR